MFLGIVVVFVLGCLACFRYPRAVLTVVYGGWVVAALQFIPGLHLIAGMIGVAVAQSLSQATVRNEMDIHSELGGFVATVVTGGILIAATILLGLVIRWIASSYTPKTPSAMTGRV